MKNCICGSKVVSVKKDMEYQVEGNKYLVPDVEVQKCQDCGEEYISEKSYQYIYDFIEASKNNDVHSLVN